MTAMSATAPTATETVDCVVVGAGVVGLAVARALAQAGREVVVVEKEIDGVTYLYDESGGFAGIPHLVLTPEQQPVGVYDPEQDHVVFQEFEVEE